MADDPATISLEPTSTTIALASPISSNGRGSPLSHLLTAAATATISSLVASASASVAPTPGGGKGELELLPGNPVVRPRSKPRNPPDPLPLSISRLPGPAADSALASVGLRSTLFSACSLSRRAQSLTHSG